MKEELSQILPQPGDDLAERLLNAGKEVGTAALMFHQAVADRLGLNTTDHKCLDFLRTREHATAGDLAEWTGLTTGAVTAVIDRLEKGGFVRREPHPSDRRKVVVQVIAERLPEVFRLFCPMATAMQQLLTTYTPAELQVILDYQLRSAELFRTETNRLREPPPVAR